MGDFIAKVVVISGIIISVFLLVLIGLMIIDGEEVVYFIDYQKYHNKVSLVNWPESSQELEAWTNEKIIPELRSTGIGWGVNVEYKDLGYLSAPGTSENKGEIIGLTELHTIKGLFYPYIFILKVSVDTSILNEDEAKIVLAKEFIGTYKGLSWWSENQYFIDKEDPEFQSLMDGLGYLATVDEIGGPDYIKPVKWDGVSNPTCSQLAAIQRLYEETLTMGVGIPSLFIRNCLDWG